MPEQHMEALEIANRIRLSRADLKRQVKAGAVSVEEVFREVPDHAATMTVAQLLASQHRWGRARARRFCVAVQIPEGARVGNLTLRQRRLVVAAISLPPRKIR